MSTVIKLDAASGFAEDKDQARTLRHALILPAFERSDSIVLDFGSVEYATQSFIHALIAEALQRYGEAALDRIEFRNCSEPVRSVIELVVDYSLGGFVEKKGA